MNKEASLGIVANKLSHKPVLDSKVSDTVVSLLIENVTFEDIWDEYQYLETWKSDSEFTSQQLCNIITSDNIWDVHPQVLRKLLRGDDTIAWIDHIVSCISSDTIIKVDSIIIDLIRNKLSNNQVKLEEIKAKLRSSVTDENEDNIERFSLDIINYGGQRGVFIRTFSPESQKRWKVLFNTYDKIKKSIWF